MALQKFRFCILQNFKRVQLRNASSTAQSSLESPVENDYYEEIKSFRESRNTIIPSNYRLKYPEFLPDPNVIWRNVIREKLERFDMMSRRENIDIPEFYVGSIMAVTTSDHHAPGKSNKFVGICISRSGCGLRSEFTLRNVVEHQGVEFCYRVYSPLIQKIETLRLEKRLDNELLYLRDAPHEYSTFPFDMEPEFHAAGSPVPINTVKVPINARPWRARYERMDLQGAVLPPIDPKFYKRAEELATPWKKYDLMDYYRSTIPEEDQKEIYSEVYNRLQELEGQRKKMKRKKAIVQPRK